MSYAIPKRVWTALDILGIDDTVSRARVRERLVPFRRAAGQGALNARHAWALWILHDWTQS